MVRIVLEEAFPNMAFERTRKIPWLNGLELDGYNPELRLAFEYQGVQHYKRVPHFHRTADAFDAQLTRDALKSDLCIDAMVTLITVPYTVKLADIRGYVRAILEDLGYDTALPVHTLEFLCAQIRTKTAFADQQYARALRVIAAKGGVCVSTHYVSYRSKLEIKCKVGHTFFASLEDIDQPPERGPRFCYHCGGTRKRTDEELSAIALERGFTFIRSGYRDTTVVTKTGKIAQERTVQLICPKGHEMKPVDWSNFNKNRKIYTGNGCYDCACDARGDAHRNSITKWCARYEINPVGKYQNATTNCNWRCGEGHSFVATHNVMKGRHAEGREACIECDLMRIENELGFKLLSTWTKHHGPSDKLVWRCLGCRAQFELSKNEATGRSRTVREHLDCLN
jgi:hypothetical protein